MSNMFDVPQWIKDEVNKWADRLRMNDVKFTVRMSLAPMNQTDMAACCQQQANLNLASITVRVDAENTREWRIYLIHELVHASHMRIDSAVSEAIIPHVAEAAQSVAHKVYEQHVESYTHQMAVALYNATCEADYPDEHKKQTEPSPDAPANESPATFDDGALGVSDLVQIQNPRTLRYILIDRANGIIREHKQDKGPYPDVPHVDMAADRPTVTHINVNGVDNAQAMIKEATKQAVKELEQQMQAAVRMRPQAQRRKE